MSDAARRAEVIAVRMNAISEETERGWSGRPEMGGYMLTRELRGVRQALTLDAGLIASAEARRLDDHARTLGEAFARRRFLRGAATRRRSPAPRRCSTR